MTNKTAKAEFQVTNWDEQPYLELTGDSKLTRAAITQTYSGDITGDGAAESLMFYAEDGSATIVSLQRVTGSIGNKSGSFMIESRATFGASGARGTWSVITGSGTRQLQGLKGKGRFTAKSGPTGSVILNYDFV
jgi:hypothetical protein